MINQSQKPDEFLDDNVVGLLLAGGQSRRMGGGDKCLMNFGDGTLLDHVVRRLEPQVETCILNANGDPERFSEFDLPVVADSVEGFAGPLAGILSGMIWTRKNRPEIRWIVSIATDTPFFPDDLVQQFLESVPAYPTICLAATAGRLHPVFGLWPTALAEDLDSALRTGVRKVLDWTDQHTTEAVEFPLFNQSGIEIDPFFNTNRREDLAKANEFQQKLVL
ncbi:MAG: molybdenum cofactor guanylyltransferase MobA [Methyloligellaceae bacterium]